RVPAQRRAFQAVLVADEATGQGLVANVARGRVGHAHHAGARALVFGAGAVDARAGHHALPRVGLPGEFGERPDVVEPRVAGPRQVPVGVASHGVAGAMTAVLGVDAGGHVHRIAAPGRRDAAADGGALDVGCHRHRHRAVGIGVAQGVVVHDVVGAVAVGAGLQHVDRAEVAAGEVRACALAPELRAVHAAAGVARAAIAGAGGQLEHGVVVGRPADRGVGVPLAPGRRHARAAAVGVVVGLRAVAVGAQVAQPIARGGVEHLVAAAR